MIFDRAPECDALIDSAERFVAERYPAERHLARIETDPPCDRQRWQEIVELGWTATDLPQARGGLGLPFSMLGAIAEALGPGLVPEPLLTQAAIVGPLLGAAADAGDAALEQWLCADLVIALAHHESTQAAYYATPITSTFERDGDDIVVTGSKTTVLDGPIADALLVSVRAAGSPHDVALVLMPVVAPDLELRPYRTFDGRTIADLEFRGTRLAAASALLPIGDADKLIDETLSRHALLVAAESVGIMRATVRLTSDYLAEREQFGQKLAGFQVLQHRLVDMQLRLTRAESLLEAAYALVDAVGFAGATSAIAAARIGTEDCGVFVAENAVQLHGGIGMTNAYRLAHFLKRLTANRFVAGERAEHALRCAV
ncbi:MAG: acyl-CoA dehydrogenase family protein [Gammaproteobacteria bacterium]|jgi:alkylation response protein AidB-like acyl-CoA dehydrogenase